jgi:hypothetical protein
MKRDEAFATSHAGRSWGRRIRRPRRPIRARRAPCFLFHRVICHTTRARARGAEVDAPRTDTARQEAPGTRAHERDDQTRLDTMPDELKCRDREWRAGIVAGRSM